MECIGAHSCSSLFTVGDRRHHLSSLLWAGRYSCLLRVAGNPPWNTRAPLRVSKRLMSLMRPIKPTTRGRVRGASERNLALIPKTSRYEGSIDAEWAKKYHSNTLHGDMGWLAGTRGRGRMITMLLMLMIRNRIDGGGRGRSVVVRRERRADGCGYLRVEAASSAIKRHGE